MLWLLGQARGAYIGLGFLYLANVTEFFGVGQAYGPLWSLAVEEHFYLLWPTAVRRLSLASVGILAASVVVAVSILRAVGFLLGDTAGAPLTCLVSCPVKISVRQALNGEGVGHNSSEEITCAIFANSQAEERIRH